MEVGNGVIKLHKFVGGDGNRTWFDKRETIDGKIKMIKYHNKRHPIGHRKLG